MEKKSKQKESSTKQCETPYICTTKHNDHGKENVWILLHTNKTEPNNIATKKIMTPRSLSASLPPSHY